MKQLRVFLQKQVRNERFDQANTRISSNSFIKLSYKLDTKCISDNFVASHVIYVVHNNVLEE